MTRYVMNFEDLKIGLNVSKIKSFAGTKVDRDSVFNDKYLKAKIKCYNIRAATHFNNVSNDSKEPRKIRLYLSACNSHYSIFKCGKNLFPKIFLEECKYKSKEEEIKSLITDKPVSSSEDEGSEVENSEENSVQFVTRLQLFSASILFRQMLRLVFYTLKQKRDPIKLSWKSFLFFY